MDERRPVTILFTDIVGSTALAEKLDPEEWKEIVNGAHQRVSDAVTRYEGTIAQLLGDGVLAFFGAPHAHEDDPARAVRAGLDIQRAISDYERELHGYVDAFQMRVGINTGMVVVGAVGSADHSEYLAVGAAVNLAARLQSAAQPGSILISESTARAVKHLFELNDLGDITLKGIADQVHVYAVQDRKTVPASGRGIEGLMSPLVGRQRELTQLREALTALSAGQGQIVFVLGEAGIGKSRLVEEARQMAADGGAISISSVRFLEGRTLSYGQSLPFWLITQLIQNDLGLADGEPEIRIKIVLRRRVKELFADKSDQALPYLAHLMGVKYEGEISERIKDLNGESLKRQVLISIADYFTGLAHRQPTALVFEDLHWADPSSLEALERLLRVTERAPLMIMALMRPESDKPAWHIREIATREYRHRFRELELEPLSSDDSHLLVENLLNIADLPGRLRTLLLERAEGNPFYLEELVSSLIEQGAIMRKGERWQATREIANVTIPDSLQALLLARIDHLEAEVKHTLQLASVIGRSFLFTLLEATSQAERELDWHLAQLQRADLVREKTRLPQLEYMFKHVLTQEAAYESLLEERRREFHRRVAVALEKLSEGGHDEFLGLLAWHYDCAGDIDKAVHYYRRAAEVAQSVYGNQEAVELLQRAISLNAARPPSNEGQKTAVELDEHLADIYGLIGRYDDAHRLYEQGLATFAESDRLFQARLHRKNARVYENQRRYEESLQTLALAEATLGPKVPESAAEWWHEWVQLQVDRVQVYYWLDKIQEMTEHVDGTLALVVQHGSPLQRGMFFQSVVLRNFRRDRYRISQETVALQQSAVEAIREWGGPSERAQSQFLLGFALLWQGNLEDAERELQGALKLAQRIGNIVIESRCWTYLTVVRRRQGQVESAKDYTQKSLQAAARGQMLEYLGTGEANLAWIAWRENQLAGAREHGQAAVELWKQTGRVEMFTWTAHLPLLAVALAESRVADAVGHARVVLLPHAMRLPDELENILHDAVQAMDKSNAQAAALLKQAVVIAMQMGYL